MTEALAAVKRLDFTLPSFCRVAWVSDKAKAVWQPVLHGITDALRTIPHVEAPACCSAFQEEVRESWAGDTTLPQALRTAGAEVLDHTVRLPSPGLLNTLWAPLGIRLLPYDPCSMHCEPSQGLAETVIIGARTRGFAKEMDALEDVLSWPVEWSALHGVAEIKTPILKISTSTVATAETYRVQLLSDRQPPHALPGLRFPYGAPTVSRAVSRPTVPRISSAPLQRQRRSSAILDETLERIRRRLSGTLPHVRSIYLSNYFNAVQLDEGSVGAAMNYCRFKSDGAIHTTRALLEAKLDADPVLLSYLSEDEEPDLLQLSLKTCVVSALSRPLLLEPSGVEVRTEFAAEFLPDARAAVIIGFGGYMDYIILRTNAKLVHVSDLDYARGARRMDRRLDYYRRLFPEKTITISDGSDNAERLAEADLISITGSAFCNGTMEALLDAGRNAKTIVVQGQSASILPEVLFEKGVTLVSTTVKPEDLLEVARTDGGRFRSLLEGKLPPTYLRPSQ
jgi:Putative heavy-metal chelation